MFVQYRPVFKVTRENVMKELIGIAVLIATLYGGTLAAGRICELVREAALTKAAHGLPKLSLFAASLTRGH